MRRDKTCGSNCEGIRIDRPRSSTSSYVGAGNALASGNATNGADNLTDRARSFVDMDDNCPEIPNPGQANFDGDEMGDACDPDIDDDGIPNAPDLCDFTPAGATVQSDGSLRADLDDDCDVDLDDFATMQLKFTGAGRWR